MEQEDDMGMTATDDMGMTATDELRRLLDGRGVEWWQSANALSCIFTRWYSPIFGDEVVAMENGEEGLVLFDHFMTPEQAIEATLGTGTCHITVQDNMTETEGMGDIWLECDACGWQMPLEPSTPRFNYCPNCGRRVEQ